MEIERKFLVDGLPASLDKFLKVEMEQAYICTEPVLRIRREGDEYFLTYKSGGLMKREEYNMPLDKAGYEKLLLKKEGRVITKTRDYIPVNELKEWYRSHEPALCNKRSVGNGRVCELDIFHGEYEGLVLAEIEFSSEAQANAFEMLKCFTEDVTFEAKYHNSLMAMQVFDS